MVRNGKIARLPLHIREELNARLHDGAQGQDLVAWLNDLDPVKKVLAAHFDGKPISEQNLSEWRKGGFREWQAGHGVHRRIHQFMMAAEGASRETLDLQIPARLSDLLALELAANTHLLLQETTSLTERAGVIRDATRTLHTLRNGDRTAALAEREEYLWDQKIENEMEALEKEHREYPLKKLEAESRRAFADAVYNKFILSKLPKSETNPAGPPPPGTTQSESIKPNPSQSDPIKPPEKSL